MTIVGGLDEVGWGALAGPLVSAIVVLKESDIPYLPPGIKDSKKTTEAQRGMLYMPILMAAHEVGIGWAWPWEMDNDPGGAMQLSYARALEGMNPKMLPDVLYVDGNNPVKAWPKKQVVEPKADAKYLPVSAASIVAKFYRDSVMAEYDRLYPQYKFNQSKGYGTHDHSVAIQKHGLLSDQKDRARYVHRRHWCRKFLR